MKNLIKFFIEAGKLKRVKRAGWVLRNVDNPESISDHTYRLALMTWILSPKNLNLKKMLIMSLIHDLCEVYSGDTTPYDDLVEKGGKKVTEKWPRRTSKERLDFSARKFKKEYEGWQKIIKYLPADLKSKLELLWLDYTQSKSKEAKFIRQIEKVENLLQAISYSKKHKNIALRPFWIEISESVYDPKIIKLVNAIKNFNDSKRNNNEINSLVKFLFEIGNLKQIRRKGWIIRGVKNPDSIASHSFRSALMGLVLSSGKKIDQEVILKMAISHDFYAVGYGDLTPYEELIEENKNNRAIFENLPWRGSQGKKEIISKKRFEEELKYFDRLVKLLPHEVRHDVKYLWLEYKVGGSREGRFLRQVDVLESLLQGLEFKMEDENLPVKSFWLQCKELIDDQKLLEFLDQIDHYYYVTKKLRH